MADEPLRLRIQKKLTEVVGRTVFRYKDWPDAPLTDAVFRGRVIFGDTDPLPMVSLLEVPLPLDQVPSPPNSTASTGRWELLLQGFVDDDHENPTDPAHWLMAQVKAELAKERRAGDLYVLGMGKHVKDMWIGPGVVRPPDELSAKAYFWLNLTLELVEDLADPFED